MPSLSLYCQKSTGLVVLGPTDMNHSRNTNAIPGFQPSPRDKALQGFYRLKLYVFDCKMAPNPYSIDSACLWYGPAWQTRCLSDPLLSFFWSWCVVSRLKKLSQIHQEYHKACVCLNNLFRFSCFSEPTLSQVPLKPITREKQRPRTQRKKQKIPQKEIKHS